MELQCGSSKLVLDQPRVMAVLNVTPDSFFDGGALFKDGKVSPDDVLRKVSRLVEDGADIVDVGGESTRPGANPVSESEELARVVPVVELIAQRFDVVCSVDTSNGMVMREAAAVGAGFINDVRALTMPGSLAAAVECGLPVCLMHMQGSPKTMQQNPSYPDVVESVSGYLRERKAECQEAGLVAGNILVDPGIGFGKTDEHNIALLKHIAVLAEVAPVLIGVSRKSMFGRLLGRPLDQRLAGSLAVAIHAASQGAVILRVHDVQETADVLRMWKLLG